GAGGADLEGRPLAVADLLSPFPQLNTTLLIGGNSHAKQDEALKFDRPVVVVGTPGRILDHCEEGRLVFEALKVVVFDEVDALFTSLSRKDHLQMLVERTMEGTEAQKILASATGATSEELAEFAEQHLRKPWLDSPWLGVEMPLGVLHLANGAPDIPKKLKFLQRLTSSIEPEPTGILVFCNNVERVRKVLQELRRMGIPSQALTGNRSAAERVDAIKNLGKGVIEVIVCTDVASRGLDFKELSHVVNFEMPPDAHAYAHRAGRVGRAGKSGIVISRGGGGDKRIGNHPSVRAVLSISEFLGVWDVPRRVLATRALGVLKVASLRNRTGHVEVSPRRRPLPTSRPTSRGRCRPGA
ncbi:unnamed protein product, partial [Prorocentrum cordatum]